MTHSPAVAVTSTTPGAMVDRIVAIYRDTDSATRNEGRAWYPTMLRHVLRLAGKYMRHPVHVAAVMAATSPRVSVQRNIAITESILAATSNGHRPDAASLGLGMRAFVRAGIRCALGTLDDMEFHTTKTGMVTGAQKTRCFYRNILGDTDHVTVDVWATRAACGDDVEGQPSGANYRAIADAYRAAAQIVGESPRDLQAIVWIATRGEAW